MRLPAALDRIDRSLVIRHFAITAAALLAYFLRVELRVGNGVLWILGAAALLNLAGVMLPTTRRLGVFALRVSPFASVVCWAALVRETGGSASPFIAGFWLEIALSAICLSPILTALVTLTTLLALWAQQGLGGLTGATTPLVVESGFLLLAGAGTFVLTRRSLRAQRMHSLLQSDLERRLRRLEKELGDARRVGKVGENVAQLAHGLKNAVHSLRGFLSLIEPGIPTHAAGAEAVEGLKAAVDRLEDLARLSLRPGAEGDPHETLRAIPDSRATLDEVAREMSAAYPGITWERSGVTEIPRVPVSSTVLREVLLILLNNAAEAMNGQGRVGIECGASGGSLSIRIRDHGCGLPGDEIERIFDPGFTTKKDGSGFGLYIARKLLEIQGGNIAAEPAPDGGALFSLAIPLERA